MVPFFIVKEWKSFHGLITHSPVMVVLPFSQAVSHLPHQKQAQGATPQNYTHPPSRCVGGFLYNEDPQNVVFPQRSRFTPLTHLVAWAWSSQLQELGGTIRVQTLTRRGILTFPMVHSVPFRSYQAILAYNFTVLSLLSLNRYGNMKTFVSSDLNNQRGRSSNRVQTCCKLRTIAVCLLFFFFTWNCRWQECPFFLVPL